MFKTGDRGRIKLAAASRPPFRGQRCTIIRVEGSMSYVRFEQYIEGMLSWYVPSADVEPVQHNTPIEAAAQAYCDAELRP